MSENFIFQLYIKDISLCDDVIEYFKISKNKHPGRVSSGVVKEIKDSTDISMSIEQACKNPIINKYLDYLQDVCEEYIKKYPKCNAYAPWSIIESINIQHYKPKQAYYGWHTERGGFKINNNIRHLVFMTYLNDVEDQGETEFYHQELKVKPRKGLTLIWPADWTYTHRGIASPTEDKYIITGWYSYHTK